MCVGFVDVWNFWTLDLFIVGVVDWLIVGCLELDFGELGTFGVLWLFDLWSYGTVDVVDCGILGCVLFLDVWNFDFLDCWTFGFVDACSF